MNSAQDSLDHGKHISLLVSPCESFFPGEDLRVIEEGGAEPQVGEENGWEGVQ